MVKQFIKRVATTSGVTTLAARRRPPCVTVLRYHSVQDKLDGIAEIIGKGITHTSDVFRQQMEIVSRHFNPVTMDDLLAFARGELALPKHCVAVTFDDGYADNYRIAAPIMQQYGIRGAVYVTVDAAESRYLPWFCRINRAFCTTTAPSWTNERTGQSYSLDDSAERITAYRQIATICAQTTGKEQLNYVTQLEKQLGAEADDSVDDVLLLPEEMRALVADGHIVGSHTMTHPNLAHVSAASLEFELRESKAKLENILGSEVKHFSYPSPILEPHWNADSISQCRRAGYATAVTCTPGVVYPSDEPLRIRRMYVPDNVADFRWAIDVNICKSNSGNK